MRLASLVLLSGVLFLHFFKHLPELHEIVCLFYFVAWLFLAAYGFYFIPCSRHLSKVLFFTGILFCGFEWAWFHAQAHITGILPSALEGKDLTLIGKIASIPEKQSHNLRFEFEPQNLGKTKRIQLSWYGQHLPDLHVGEVGRWHVRLKRPQATFNPGALDYERWLFEHRIQAVGYIVNMKNCLGVARTKAHSSLYMNSKGGGHVRGGSRTRPPCIEHFPYSSRALVRATLEWTPPPLLGNFYCLRQWIYTQILEHLPHAPFVGFLSALSVGIRERVTPDQWQILQHTGTNHLIAIAGLHVGFVSGMAYWGGKYLWRHLGHACLFLPAPQIGAVAAFISALAYSALAGFALPTQRALLMLSIFLSSTLLRKHLLPWQAWCFALIVLLIFDPLSTLSMSFWLSFGTVGILLYGMGGRIGVHSKISRWLRPQWVITLGIIPLSLLFFHQCALIGVIANAIAIPWIGCVVLPLCLLSIVLLFLYPPAAHVSLYAAEHAMEMLWPFLIALAHTSWLQWQGIIFNPWILISTLGGCLLLLAPRGLPARWVGLLGLLPLLTWQVPGPQKGDVWFTLLDVGQGLASVIRTQHHVLIYDTGAKYSDTFDMGSSVVIPFLQMQGIHHIDDLVISHADNDHRGGAASVLQHLSVSQIITSAKQYFPPEKTIDCIAGRKWDWEGVHFEFLYPWKGSIYLNNDSSCVLRISTGHHSLLLPGDIEKRSERALLKTYGRKLHSDIIVAPHHGSRTSSTLPFVRAVHPSFVLYSVGYRNRYRFPSKTVMARYQQEGSKPYQTSMTGALTLKFSGEGKIPLPESYREIAGRFWNF